MPPKGNNKKKKQKARNRNEAAVSCVGCAAPLRDDGVYCLCTKVRFCSPECQQSRPHRDCPGPPEARIDMDQRLRDIRQRGVVSNVSTQEMDITVTQPMIGLLMSQGLRVIYQDLKAKDYAAFADQGEGPGNIACAYLAGCRYKHRLLGIISPQTMVARNTDVDEIGVLESQELAFRYFEKAAKLGHGLSMQSLGECYDDGIGCRVNRRLALNWIWPACLQASTGAADMLETRALLPLEINAQAGMLQQIRYRLAPGQGMSLCGPNLASLLLALHPVAEREGYTLPPFAAIFPTLAVGVRPRAPEISGRVPLIGCKQLKEVVKLIKELQRRGNQVHCQYGRRGVAKAATTQTHDEAARSLDNQIFLVPPAPTCNETPTLEELSEWTATGKNRQHWYGDEGTSVHCIHVEKAGRQSGTSFCAECLREAAERLSAVSSGSVAISLSENIPQRGQAAIFRVPNGSIKSETWKTYGRGEAECALALLVAAKDFDSAFTAHPLFVAQDPNLFWPLIEAHGCVRAALEYVAPHVDWEERLGAVKEPLEQVPICEVVGGHYVGPGTYLRRCGNDFCTNLQPDKQIGLRCSICERRYYCSDECLKVDYKVFHKQECKAATAGLKVRPRVLDDENGTEGSQHQDTGPEKEEDVVIHGLVAKPEYNGKIGTVIGDLNDGRYPLKLRTPSANEILVLPVNLYRIGVFSKKRKKKSRRFECFTHGLELCSHCYFDFGMVNRVAWLNFSGRDINDGVLDQVNDAHYATIKIPDTEEEVGRLDAGWPLECHGMGSHERQRFVLNALLEHKGDLSVCAAAGRAAMIAYGGRGHRILRTVVNSHLETFAALL